MSSTRMHPYLSQSELKAFADSNGILITAYSPTGDRHIACQPCFMLIRMWRLCICQRRPYCRSDRAETPRVISPDIVGVACVTRRSGRSMFEECWTPSAKYYCEFYFTSSVRLMLIFLLALVADSWWGGYRDARFIGQEYSFVFVSDRWWKSDGMDLWATGVVNVEKWIALLSSKPVGNRIRIEDGKVIFRPSIVEKDCSAERWLQNDLGLKRFGWSTGLK